VKVSIVTELPFVLIIFCLLLAGIAAWFLYRKDSKFEGVSKLKIRLMTTLRFLSVFFISFLLLSPLIKSVFINIEKPVIIVAQDNTESILMQKDSATYLIQHQIAVDKLMENLRQTYDVNYYVFGEKVTKADKPDYKDKQTDFSKLFEQINTKYLNRNVGAMIVLSDGIFTKGQSPVYAATDVRFPIYTVALGDTGMQKDVALSQVKTNKIAFLGNIFPLQITVDIKDLNGFSGDLVVTNDKKQVFKQRISANTKEYTTTINVDLKAEKTGIQHYIVEIASSNEEKNVKNNIRDIVVDVINNKQKILVLAEGPHPDVAALRKTLKLNQNFQSEFYTTSKFSKRIQDYNLVVLYQLPSMSGSEQALLSQIIKSEIPLLVILGNRTNFAALSNLNLGLQVQQNNRSFDDALPTINQQFTMFEIPEDVKQLCEQVPPLNTPFGVYKYSQSAQVLMTQRIKNIQTQNPLIILDNTGERKMGFIAGEGIWRWRIYDYVQNQNHDAFNELINKMMQFLSLKVNKENFVLNIRNLFNETEPITALAEVYNQIYDPVANAEIKMEITGANQKKFNFNFEPDASGTKTYYLNAGILPVGDYSYVATAKNEGKTYVKNGKFSIIALHEEAQNTIANHNALYQLSKKHDAELVFPAQLLSLEEKIKQNKNIVPISNTERDMKDLVYYKWIFFIFLFLLCSEWLLRKFFGSY